MIKRILLGVVGAVVFVAAVVVGIALSRPDTFKVGRQTVVSAPPSAIFPYLEDFRRFGAWSPWEKLDPNMKRTYSGPQSGPGATYAWTGNDAVGEGKMTIVDVEPDRRVTIRLEFTEPMESTNTTVWALEPAPGGTRVTWSMEGPNSFAARIFSVFGDLDAIVGKDFEAGLANLKRAAESS